MSVVGKVDISVVIPLYNEEESLPELSSWIEKVMLEHGFAYEVIMVDDGSTDDSWRKVEEICKRNTSFKGIRFATNYGKSAALNVGFKHCAGEVVITMDADLQDSPDEIQGLYNMIAKEDYDMVSGWKQKRYDPISKTIPSKFFNYVTCKVSGINLHDFNCGLKAYKNEVVKNIEVYGEMHRYIPLIAKWSGFSRIGEKVVQHRERKYGVTKFGLERFVFGFLDLLSISFVSRFKKKPMHFFGTMGMLSFLTGVLIAFYLLCYKQYVIFIKQDTSNYRDVVDNPFFYIGLVALVIGVQLFLAGYLAELLNVHSDKKDDYSIRAKAGF